MAEVPHKIMKTLCIYCRGHGVHHSFQTNEKKQVYSTQHIKGSQSFILFHLKLSFYKKTFIVLYCSGCVRLCSTTN